MSDLISSNNSSPIDFDQRLSPHYKTIAELQGQRYRETGLMNQQFWLKSAECWFVNPACKYLYPEMLR